MPRVSAPALGRGDLFAPWTALAVVCTLAMVAGAGEETIPYHLGYGGFALAYGLDSWSLRRALLGLAAYTVGTGVVLVERAAAGVVGWGETAEIPMMSGLMLLMVWHVRRRQAALTQVTRVAERDRDLARRRELLARLTSHEMRTPLTIALGYLDLVASGQRGTSIEADLDVVRDELGRLNRASDRLLRMIRFEEDQPLATVSVDVVIHETAQRWATVADRTWQVSTDGGLLEFPLEQLRTCLDTLLENAVRYTVAGDVIRLFSSRDGDRLLVGVADAGPGMGADLVGAVNASRGAGATLHREWAADPRSQTGLGLELVREVVATRGGFVAAGRAAEGGALVMMVLPVRCVDVPHPRTVTRPVEARLAVPGVVAAS